MQRILFYSFKGGVGRSLCLCNTAAALWRRGMRVGLLDFDVEAPSLHLILSETIPTSWQNRDLTPDILTLLRTDSEFLTPKAVKETSILLNLPKASDEGHCILLPCLGRAIDLDGLDAISGGWDMKRSEFNTIIEMLKHEFKLDFLLIDARTGYAQQMILPAYFADQVVAVSRPDNVSLLGMKSMLEMFQQVIDRVHLVISGLPESIRLDDPRLVSFLDSMGNITSRSFLPYVAEWYFGGKIDWLSSDSILSTNAIFDKIASFLCE